MKHTDIINKIIEKNNFKSYLEIGVGDGESFKKINCELKESCDPYNDEKDGMYNKDLITYHMTSDEMFKNMDTNKKYDVIFIDGLHIGNQVLKDLWNSLNHITENGYVLIHDSVPLYAGMCSTERCNGEWVGTVYKIYPILLKEDINFYILNDDFGIGVVRGNQKFKSINVPQESDMSFKEVFYNTEFDYPRLYKMRWAYQMDEFN